MEYGVGTTAIQPGRSFGAVVPQGLRSTVHIRIGTRANQMVGRSNTPLRSQAMDLGTMRVRSRTVRWSIGLEPLIEQL